MPLFIPQKRRSYYRCCCHDTVHALKRHVTRWWQTRAALNQPPACEECQIAHGIRCERHTSTMQCISVAWLLQVYARALLSDARIAIRFYRPLDMAEEGYALDGSTHTKTLVANCTIFGKWQQHKISSTTYQECTSHAATFAHSASRQCGVLISCAWHW